MWYLYMLRCSDGTFYTGITTDVPKRLEKHNKKRASRYTRARLPVELVYREKVPDHSAALRREIEVKKMTRLSKIALMERSCPGKERK